MSNLLSLDHVSKVIEENGNTLTILKDVTLSVRRSECLIVLGASGSGKSTLLNILGTLDTPTSGEFIYKGIPIEQYSIEAIAGIRQRDISFIFQFYHLLPEFTVLENILLKASLANISSKEAKKRALHLLEQIGMIQKKDTSVTCLSGGEKQRVSIARALVTNPVLLLADEPTGSLDRDNGIVIMDLLARLQQEYETAIVMVTHNRELILPNASYVTMSNGEVQRAVPST